MKQIENQEGEKKSKLRDASEIEKRESEKSEKRRKMRENRQQQRSIPAANPSPNAYTPVLVQRG